jgi:hypothetical protein
MCDGGKALERRRPQRALRRPVQGGRGVQQHGDEQWALFLLLHALACYYVLGG